MKVSELLEILSKQDPDAEIIVRGDIHYPVFAMIKTVIPGNFKLTDYGNDFSPYEVMLMKDEFRAVLIEASEESDPNMMKVFKTDLRQ